ncbi:MAG: hypothetical protein ABH877_00125 [bacterium]
MQLWKFVIEAHEWVQDPEDPAIKWMGCVACTIAETREGAVAALTRYAAENGLDARWLRAARVVQIPIIEGAVGAWAQV